MLTAYLWNNFTFDRENSILVIGLILLLLTNITILITNGFNFGEESMGLRGDGKNTISDIEKNETINSENLPDPLEEGFDLPV